MPLDDESTHSLGRFSYLQLHCTAKVRKLQEVLRHVHQDVLELEVAMYQTLPMQLDERETDLTSQFSFVCLSGCV